MHDPHLRVIRDRLADLEAQVGALANRPLSTSQRVAKITDLGHIPTTTGVYFAANPANLIGTEVEGGPASAPADSSVIYVLMVGSQAPVAGDLVVAKQIHGRWVAQKLQPSNKPKCQPCNTPLDGSDAESVSWNLQSLKDSWAQLNGQTLYCYDCFSTTGLQAIAVTCWQPYANPGNFQCTGGQACNGFFPCYYGQWNAVMATNTGFTNPLTFTLGPIGPYIGSPVQLLGSWTWGAPQFPSLAGVFCPFFNTTINYWVQCWKLCNYTQLFPPKQGANYVLSYVALNAQCPKPIQIGPPPFEPILASGGPAFCRSNFLYTGFGALDVFFFPNDGSSGVISCSPLSLALSKTVTTQNCGMPQLNSTNSISVTA
jgi:hypothetical protein